MKECVLGDPKLVCQVGFVEWTSGGKLRHPTFVGIRDDKRPASVDPPHKLHTRELKARPAGPTGGALAFWSKPIAPGKDGAFPWH